jgi:hypothetical protein
MEKRDMTKHANLAPSQSATWEPCPGSVAMIEAIPKKYRQPSGYYAQLGTAAHGLLERCLSTGHEPAEYLGRIIELLGEDENVSILKPGAKMPDDEDRAIFVVDTDMIEAVETAVAYVLGRMEELGEGTSLSLEKSVRVLDTRDDCFGTADVVMSSWPDTLEVDDYKNGSGVLVEVEDNHQLRSYLLGAAREDKFSHDEYIYAVIQPRAPHSDGPIRSEAVSRKELLQFGLMLERAAKRVDESRAIMAKGGTADDLFEQGFLEAGTKQCKWCEAAPTCPAALAKAEEIAGADFDDEPRELTAETDPERLGLLLPWIPFLDSWARAVSEHAQRVAESGGHVEDHKLVHKGSKRRWREVVPNTESDELTQDKLLEIMNGEFAVDAKSMLTKPALITGPQAEKLVEKKRRAEFSDMMLHKPDGPLTLVHVDDKRPEVVVDVASDFED